MAVFYKDGKPINSQGTPKNNGAKFTVVKNKDTKNTLEYDGVKFGTVTNKGLKAIENNTLDSYTPETEEEKRAIRSYLSYQSYYNKTKTEKEKRDKGASALLGANDKIADYIADKYPITPPTTPSSTKTEADSQTKDKKDEYKVPFKYKEGSGLPDLAQMQKTAFGDVKVDLTPKPTDTQVADFMNKKEEPPKPKNTLLGNIGGVLLSVPYAVEKAGAGAINAVESVGEFLLASGARIIGSDMLGDVFFVPDSVSEKIRNYGGEILENKGVGERWSENIENRYAVHDWTRSNIGVAFEGVGNLIPAIASEIYTASASPMGDMWLAKYIFGKSPKLATTANKVGSVANKVSKVVSPSEVIFGLGAAGQSASEGYRISGDLSKSLDYGTASGLLEVAIERLSGGIAGTKYGKSILNYTTKSKPLSLILGTGGEAVEEMVSTFIDTPLRRLTVDKNAEWADLKDYYESGKQGMFISLIMGVATYPFRNTQRKEAIKTLNVVTEELKEVAIDKNKIPSPLNKNASIEDIQQRQKELQEIAEAYANQVVAETEAKESALTNETGKTQTPTVVNPSTLNKGKVETTPTNAVAETAPVVETTVTEAQTPIKAEETVPTTKGITSAYTNNNQKIDLRYKVVSADDLIASNNADGTVNPNYPQEYQPRERTRTASIMQVQNIANNIVPEKLGESVNVSDGAPIVNGDNVVESGNGRTMALKLMYQTNPESAKQYVEYIKANADTFGIDVNNLPNNPVLVRERLTDVDIAEFVKQANESNLSAMSATELAKSDAERLSGDILNLLVPNDDGNINTQDNRAFIGRVISNVFSQNDLNSVVSANGMLSANGLERIRNAMFYKAYNDVSLASKLSESLDNDIKNITNVLVNIAPKIVQIKNGIANGTLYDLDFSQDIVDGINYLQEAKRQDLKVKDFAKQITIGEDVSDAVKFIALFFEQKNRGAKQATLFFNHLCDTILSKDPNQIGFLNEDTKTPTKEKVLYEAINKYNNDEQGTGIDFAEMLVSQRSEEPRQAVDTRGIGDNVESVTESRPVDSESDGTSEQHGYVEEETALAGNIDTQRQGERGTEERRPANRTDETEVGAGELSEESQLQIEALEKKMQAIMARFGLTEEEANAVLEYKTAEAYKINAKLREDENLLTDAQKDIVKLLDSALEKLPKYKGKVYRTVSFDDVFNAEEEYNSFLETHSQDSVVFYDAYTSVSSKSDGHPMSDKTKYSVTLEIDGESGRDIDGFGNNFEKEVVYPRGFSFIVTNVTTDNQGRPYIKLKEVVENARQQGHTEERSNILQQMSTEEELHGNLHKISEQDTQRSAETKNSVQRIPIDTEKGISTLTDKCELIETKHTATKKDIWVVTIKERLSTDDFNALREKVKEAGGYYSRFTKTLEGKAIPGFVFTSEPTSNELNVFNDFFGGTEETPTQNAQNTPKSNETKSGKETPTETENIATEPNLSDTEVKENANDEQRHEVLDGESGNDDAGLQSESRNADEEEGTERVSGDSGQTSGEVLPTDTVNRGRNKSDVGNDSEGRSRTDDNGDVGQEGERTDSDGRGHRRAGEGKIERGTSSGAGVASVADGLNTETKAPEVIETVDKAIEKDRPSNKENFVITNDVAEELDNNLPSAKDNIEAIELLLKIENEGRTATEEEKRILAKYKGWGGIDTRYMDWELRNRLNNLYDYDQRRSMQDSGMNAFFTPTKVIDAMYNGLKRMGFKGGNVLETSMGIGNFFGRMPRAIVSKSALTGIELEAYTARIAQLLYPGATVINKPFQDVVIKNGAYDLVIGNVPFGNEKLSYNGKKYSLHNYFIISSLDKVKDGGVVAVITSAGTLDNYAVDARKAIMDRADVVACYKLPAGVFSRNAKTDVQSDLLILRKRPSGQKAVGDSILNVTEKNGLKLNEYFVKHPENILGTLAEGSNAWGKITTVLNNGKFDEMLSDAMNQLPKNLISGEVNLKPVDTIITTESKPRFFEKDGKIYEDNGAGEAVAVKRNVDVIRDFIAVREAYKTMLDAYSQDLPESEIKPLREALNKAYDNFYAKHTAISGDGKKKIGKIKCRDNTFLEADSDYYLLCGLERYNKKENKFEKSALFEKDTLRKKKVTSVDTSSEALAIALNETGGIDFRMMSELTGKTEKELADELKGEIVFTPQGKYELLDIYLSGDIYAKLEEVKGKPEFKEQEEMLKKVLPTPKDASQITVKLGANFIDSSYIEDFSYEIFGERISVKKNSAGNWVIDGADRGRYGALVNSKYGCKGLNAVQLLQRILNDADIVCNKTVEVEGKKVSVLDKEMTDIALGKAQDIRDAFDEWIFKDTRRRNDIVDKYNRTYNAVRPLDYEHIASKLTFNTMNPTLRDRLYPHQRKGIARFLFGGNTLFAHGVGTGKTFEMIASVMEAKQMGIVNKTAMVVPNNKVVDFKKDILEAYPNAKVLVVDTANKKRQTMLGLVNSNDWDIILIARTTFTKIPVSEEMQRNFYNEQLEALEREIYEAEGDRNVSKRQINGLIKQRKTLEEKLKDLDKETDRDVGVDFDNLGIDCICVDEAHNYKSVTTPSKLQIKGLVNKNDAQQANDMLMKLDYLRSIDGKIIFGTGTPITNTVSEIYNMTRMVRPDILENAGIHSLDEWVNTFAKVESNFEMDIDGTIKTKPTKSIRSFVNSKEMVAMFRQFADIVFTQDVVHNLPKAIHHSIEIEGKKEHKLIKQAVNDVLSSAKGTEKLGAYGTMSGLLNASSVDLRMIAGVEKDGNPLQDYTAEELDYEDSKINTMCGNVMKHYKESQKIKGTQIIFCDGGAGSGTTYTFNAHKDIREKLIAQGIPENEVVIIKNQNEAKLEELYAQVNSGEVRVLIGTSAKMAEGLNVQERVVAIHHPTVSYKPSDLEQSDARGVRSGNINEEVHIYRYLQGDTFDSHKWQAIDRKSEMIRNALKGEDVGELEDVGADEDGGADVDPATAMAITSGNPLVKAKIDIDKKVNSLLTVKKNYQSNIFHYQDIIAKNPTSIRTYQTLIGKIKEDIALRDKYADNTKIIIKGKSYEKQGEANKALIEAVKTTAKNGQYIKIGEYNGFDIMFKGETGGIGYSLLLKGSNDYKVEYNAQGNTMARFAGVLNRLDKDVENYQNLIERLTKDLETAKQEVNKPFEREAELQNALAEQKQITYDYEHYSEVKDKYEGTDTNIAEESDEDVSYDKASTDNRWETANAESESKSKKDVALDKIVKKIHNRFGITIATGKVQNKEARGVYKERAEVIRTRETNNVPTITHELGHHLDKKYSFSKTKKSTLSLAKALPQEFLNQYPAKQRGREAVAEFVRIYLKSKLEAHALSEEFFTDFINTLSEKDLNALDEIGIDFNRYLTMDAHDKYKSTIVNSKRSLKEKVEDVREGGIEGVKDSVVDKANETYTNWIDAFNPIKNAVDFVEKTTDKTLDGKDSAYTLATNSLNATTIASYLVNDGFRDLNGNILEEMSFKECIQGVNAKDLDTLSEYLVLKHSLELIKLDMRAFADDTLQDVDTINQSIADIERNHPEMIEASENLYQYQRNMLKYYLVDSGLLSEEGFNAMVEKYPCYVPFYRDVSKKGQGRAKGTFANQKTPISRIKGSGASILNPLESIVKNTEKFVKASTKNQVMQVLAEYVNEVEGFGQFIEKVTPDMLPHLIDITKQKEKFTERLQQTVNAVDYFNVTNLLDEVLNDTVMDFTPKANASKKLVTVMENGHASYYQIHDEALYKAVAEMSAPQLEGALKTITKIMLPMKMLMTQVNPLFASSNFFRDFGTAYKHSQINNPIEFAVRYMGALKSIIANDEMYQQYKAMGGGHSSKLATDIDQIQHMLHDLATKDMGKARRLAYSLFRHPLETITFINDIVESVPRVLEFTKTLEESGDLQQAIFNADDITTNFKRHGSGVTAKFVNSMVFFNNASLQGLDKTRRSLTGKDATAKLTKWALFALLSSALQYYWNREKDEEGYKLLSSYTKNNFYNYAIGDGKFISIPKPREVALLDSFTERTIEYVFGNEDAFYDFGGYLADNLLPPMLPEPTLDIVKAGHDVLGNTVLGGIIDVGYNQNFMGRPIESKYEENYLESWERWDEGTSKLAYNLGQTELARNIDMSPQKIDHLLSSYLGIIGSAIKAVFPMDETRKDLTFGLRNRFIKDSVYSNDVINKLWENTDKAEAQFKYDSTIDNAIEYEQNAIITNYISEMYEAIYSLPAEEQREARQYLLKELHNWNYDLTTSQQQMKTTLADRAIEDNIVVSLPSSRYEWTENKQKYSYQMTPEEYSKFAKNYLKEIEKYRTWCKKTYTNQDDYLDNLSKYNGAVMKYMRPYYNKQFKSKATKQ
jgi:N12 class adenine-specific DNA methylase